MNIKRIIREELEAVLDSFYLLVSEDENFIYTRGHLGGYRWESVNGLDPKEIMNSGFKEYSEPEGMISRMKREERSRGEETPNYLKPKIVPVDFILRKRDESFPIMESNELDWIKNVDPLSGGEYYDDSKAICFGDSLRYCDVRITNKYITFYFNRDELSDFWDEEGNWEDDRWIVEALWQNGTPYDGDGDWYEFDSDEFNYSYYRLGDDQKNRFNEILSYVGSGERIENFEDEMNSLTSEFKHPKIQSLFEESISEYLNQLGYTIQKNRWLDISNEWDGVSKQVGVEVSMSGDEIEIKIPIEKAYQNYYSKGVNDLTGLLKAIIKKLVSINWYEWFYDEWDTSGGDEQIDQAFNDFLDKTEDYLDSEFFEKYEKVLSDFKELGIKNKSTNWYNYNQVERVNPNDDTIWIIDFKSGYEKADLKLHKKHSSTYYGNQDVLEKHVDVPVEEISKYIKPL